MTTVSARLAAPVCSWPPDGGFPASGMTWEVSSDKKPARASLSVGLALRGRQVRLSRTSQGRGVRSLRRRDVQMQNGPVANEAMIQPTILRWEARAHRCFTEELDYKSAR